MSLYEHVLVFVFGSVCEYVGMWACVYLCVPMFVCEYICTHFHVRACKLHNCTNPLAMLVLLGTPGIFRYAFDYKISKMNPTLT